MRRKDNGCATLSQKTRLAKHAREDGLLSDLVQAAKDVVKDGDSLS